MVTIIVTTLNDEDNSTGGLSLREAIKQANASEAEHRIVFAAGLSGGTIALTLGALKISGDLTIDGDVMGEGRPGITIDAGGASRVFEVESDNADIDRTVVLRGLDITGGHAAADGGAIWNSEALHLIGSTVTNSTVGNAGGGIYNRGDMVIEGSTISGNRATKHHGGAIKNDAQLEVINSTIASNTAQGAAGGILSQGPTTLTVKNSTVTGNRSNSPGSGLYVGSHARVVVVSSIVTGNTRSLNERNVYGSISASHSLIDVDPALVFAQIDPVTGGGMLADNGGATPTVALDANTANPALDAANPNAPAPFDQNGAAAFDADGDGIAQRDIGASELLEEAVALFEFQGAVNGNQLEFTFIRGETGYAITYEDGGEMNLKTIGALQDLALVPVGPAKAMVWYLTEDGFVGVTALDGALEPDVEALTAVMEVLNDRGVNYVAMMVMPEGGPVHLLDAGGYLHTWAQDETVTSFTRSAEPLFTAQEVAARKPAQLVVEADGRISLSDPAGAVPAVEVHRPELLDSVMREALQGIVRLDDGKALMAKDGYLFQRDADGASQKLPAIDIQGLEAGAGGALALQGSDSVLWIAQDGTQTTIDFAVEDGYLLSAGHSNDITYALDSNGAIQFRGALDGSLVLSGTSLIDLTATPEGLWGLTEQGALVRIDAPTQSGTGQTAVLSRVGDGSFVDLRPAAGGSLLSLVELREDGTAQHSVYDHLSGDFTATQSIEAPGFLNATDLKPQDMQ
ncbi:MAG: choice-of-anchor Q domain-containing protein, partial [Nitratireductor sp.]